MSLELIVVLVGAFLAALGVGLAGFADALIAAAVWLHVLPPVQAVPLIMATGMVIHLLSIVHLRKHIQLRLLWPFVIGGAIGVPIGTWMLSYVEPEPFRLAVGVFLLAYCLFAFMRPHLKVVAASRPADGTVGLVGGVLGGFAGLSGVVPTLWAGMRGWRKDVQRGIYQPFIFVMHGMGLGWLAGSSMLDPSLLTRWLWCLPAVLLGTWLGLKLYGWIDDQQFRRIVLVLLFLSGASLVVF